ncbi:MAG TPA: DUF92 domain-containing protein [Gemmatimonadaceae bacterium]|nr:DUF92 domain-containing protein [Gemmatimonadaceae bacterium]
MIERAAAGLALAAAIALAAVRAGSLTSGGALAAAAAGTTAVAAGWRWGVLLIAFFVTSTALSRFGAAAKERRTGGIGAKGGRRDARQVLANGGTFTLAAALSLLAPWPLWFAAGAGALAAAAADTWGTEIGTLAPGEPRLVTTGKRVPAGTSGAVSPPGLAATLVGALFMGALVCILGEPPRVGTAVAAGGVAGALTDTLLGALAQERRWCPRCREETEQHLHRCGTRTVHARGVAWLDNDAVNLLCGVAGAVVAIALAA